MADGNGKQVIGRIQITMTADNNTTAQAELPGGEGQLYAMLGIARRILVEYMLEQRKNGAAQIVMAPADVLDAFNGKSRRGG